MSRQTLIGKIALPYAEALLELVQQYQILEKANQDILILNQALLESTHLNIFFANLLIKS